MDSSAKGEGPLMVAPATPAEIRQPQRRTRRRLVQSTLFPHKSPESESNPPQDQECSGQGDDCHGEEHTGGAGKKKRIRKGKATPQSKTPKKSPAKSTPNKRGKTSPSDALVSPTIPNLRLEAKLMAEETSRMFAGKGIHPFFSVRKESKRSNETGAESNCCVLERKDTCIGHTIGPIHVFEKERDDVVHIDWRNWELCEGLFANSTGSVQQDVSSVSDGSTELLCLDNVSSGLYPSGMLVFREDASLDRGCCQQEFLHEALATVSRVPSDAQVPSCQVVKDAETDCAVGEVGVVFGCIRKSDAEQQSELVQERIMSSYFDCDDKLEDRLWIDKYQPKKAMEVCGNGEAVKFLSDWLQNWNQGGRSVSKSSSGGSESDMQDVDYNCLQSDSDLENVNEGTVLKNVLLITGPVGSGKSAAIYACAKEQGFKVLEVNSSDCRNGAMVKQRFGEALGSHSLEWSHESHMELQSKHGVGFATVFPYCEMTQEFDNDDMIAVLPTKDGHSSNEVPETSEKLFCKDSSIACGSGQLKHLILFEDVDITFAEDRGFISAIQQIAEKAKGPVILTSNSDNPVLPANLDRLEVCFMMPSMEELLQHVNMVCSEENANIQPHLMEELVEYCQGDIRKTIMHLQFWCRGGEMQTMSAPLPFDPVAGHRMLPKMIPWDFPSQLSELVEKEISVSLSKMKEPSALMEIKEECDNKELQNNLKMDNIGTSSIDAKKAAMLSRNCSEIDSGAFKTPYDAACNSINPTGTPISFSLRSRRRKREVVLSSDSEDELVNGQFPTTSEKDANNELDLEIYGERSSYCQNMQNCSSPLMDQQPFSETRKLEESCYERSETTIDLPMEETCKSFDASCVPESSFVPETEINNLDEGLLDSVSFGQVAGALEEISVSNDTRQNLSPVECDSPDESTPVLDNDSDLLASTFNAILVSAHEEVEDSQNESVEDFTREYQGIDECSRMDFNREFKPAEQLGSCLGTDTVRELWRKFHDHRTDLKHLVTLEHEISSGVKLADGMSNLISEAEVLLSKCQTDDSLELPMVLSEVSDAHRWCDVQWQMTSTIARCGFCVYAKDIVAVELNLGAECRMDLNWDTLSTIDVMEIGSFGQNLSSKTKHTGKVKGVSMSERPTLFTSEMKPRLLDIIQSIVPSRLHLSVKGHSFYEYLSSLGLISRSEGSRLSESINKTTRRRRRAAPNYLSIRSPMLSPEDISLLGQSNIYRMIPSQSAETNFR